jgi:hypothetical protein
MVRRGIVVPEYEEVSGPAEETEEQPVTLPESPLPESPVAGDAEPKGSDRPDIAQ